MDDLSFVVKHTCRNICHLSLKLNNSQEESELSGVHILQRGGDHSQSAGISTGAPVEPATPLNYTSGVLTSFATKANIFMFIIFTCPSACFNCLMTEGGSCVAQMSTVNQS